MSPLSTKITEMQHVETTQTKTYGLQNSRSKLLHNYPNIGNGMPLKYLNIFLIVGIHFWALYSVFVVKYSVPHLLWNTFITIAAGFGVTGGVHRYWTHKTYKANLPLRIILMICYSISGQYSIFNWVRDHRVHHKFSDTDADPHNASNGFFFSHVGWLMQRKHPEVIRRGNQIDMSDVLSDPVVQFSQKYFIPLKIMFCFLLPTMIPVYLFGEDWYNLFMSQCLIRYCMTLNITWSVNSAAHIWGTRPYDKNIRPAENRFVSIITFGEGWHNYHHVFPWDYKTAEMGDWFNWTTMVLNFFRRIGWAWDMKEPSKDLVQRVMACNADKHIQHLPEIPPPAE